MDYFSSDLIEATYSRVNSKLDDDGKAIAQDFLDLCSPDLTEIEAKAEFLNDLFFRGPAIIQAEEHSGKTYMYYWEEAIHAAEIPYVLNTNESYKTFAERVQAMWVNFAVNGVPSTEWPVRINKTVVG